MRFIFVRTVLLALFVSSTMAEKLFHNMALSYEHCIEALTETNQTTFPNFEDGNLWCNATFDGFLCWPAVPANSSAYLPCPPWPGLLPDRTIEKVCHESGRWKGRGDNDFTKPEGYTNFRPCMMTALDIEKSNMALRYDACIKALTETNQTTFPNFHDGDLWCNATVDEFLCWPAVPANSSAFLPCPPLRGLLPDKKVEKICHESGRWKGRDDNDFTKPEGYTDYMPCMDLTLYPWSKEIEETAKYLR